MKIYKVLIGLFVLFALSGCSERIVYLDENGTEVTKQYQFKEINLEVVCDKRGYAYYRDTAGYSSLTPVLYNGTYGTYQHKCDEL